MKKLLYIGGQCLGGNIHVLPCLEMLSKEYEITLLVHKYAILAFCRYPFIEKVLPTCNVTLPDAKLPIETISYILKHFTHEDSCYYAYHNDHDNTFLKNHPELSFIKKYPVLTDNQIKLGVSETQKIFQKLQLVYPIQAKKINCLPPAPPYIPGRKNNSIIIYQGSYDWLRKLTTATIGKFVEKAPDAMYFVDQDCINTFDMVKNKIKHICIYPISHDSLDSIIKTFQSQPKVLIGPDSGLTQLATCYRIPLIWLESRIRIENIIDNQYKNLYKVYKRKTVNCKQECQARVATNKFGPGLLNFAPCGFKFTNEDVLECRTYREPPNCLDYTVEEVNEILSLI